MPYGSEEAIFLNVLTIYGRDGHLDHVTQKPRTKFSAPSHAHAGPREMWL